jgi:hypothetical protein
MSLRHYINLIEKLATVPPTVEPTTTPEEEQTIDDATEASAQFAEPEAETPDEPQQRSMPATR